MLFVRRRHAASVSALFLFAVLLPLVTGAHDGPEEPPAAHIQGIEVGDHWTFRVTGQETGEIRNRVAALETKTNALGKTHESIRIDAEGEFKSDQSPRRIAVPLTEPPRQEIDIRIALSKWVRVSDHGVVHLEGRTWVAERLDATVKEAYDPPLIETLFPFTDGYAWNSGAYHYLQRGSEDAQRNPDLMVTVRVIGQETVTVPAGTFHAWKLNITGGKDPDGYTWRWYAEEACDIVKEERYRNRGEFVNRLELTSFSCARTAKVSPTYDPDWVTLVTTGGAQPPVPRGVAEAQPEPGPDAQAAPASWLPVMGAILVAALVIQRRRS